MSCAASDRNLLFGVLALQMDFLDRDALIAALNAWVIDKARPLGEILVAQHVLNPDERDLLDALVQKHLDRHQGDVEKSLAAVAVSTPVRQQLHSLADADVQTRLSRLPTPARPAEPGQLTTTAEIQRDGESRYHVLRPHDKGGIGEVFVALDQELNREVALKEIQEQHADDAPSVGRFVREAEITGGLEHPGIVPVYGLGQYADGRPYYAMRFIRGETFKDAIRKHHAGQSEWTLRALLMRFVTVCNTLAYAHSRGVIHRDVKPANIMLGQYGETLVVDWGMAKAVEEPVDAASRAASGSARLAEPTLVPRLADSIETQAGSALGTPAYMSPEQAAGRLDLLSPASDIYSLGATLYTLLTGRPPIEGKDTAEILRKAQKGEWQSVRQVKPDVPVALAAICQKAMALAPSARYGTALELAKDVEHWLADEPVAAYRESWLERLRRWMRRHRTLVSTAVGVLLVALAGTSAGLVLVRDAQQQEKAARKDAEDKKEEARFNQYVAEMNLVQREYEANNMVHVRELLAAQLPQEANATDLRNFEWHYWQHMANRELRTLKGHTDIVSAVAFSPDGRRLASAGKEGTVRLWDVATGEALRTFQGNIGLLSVAFSPDGRRLAAGGVDTMVRVWDTVTGKALFVLNGHEGGVAGVSFSSDGRRLASASRTNRVRVWDAATGKELYSLEEKGDRILKFLTFSSDGQKVAWEDLEVHTVLVWDIATGKELLVLKGHTAFVHNAAFSADGRRLFTSGSDHMPRIWDVTSGKGLLVSKELRPGSLPGGKLNPDGGRLASTGQDGRVHIWDAATLVELFALKGHTGPVISLAFSPDGLLIASASVDHTVRIWDAVASREPLALKHYNTLDLQSVAFSPDGRRVVVVNFGGGVHVWDAATGQELSAREGDRKELEQFQLACISPDARLVASNRNEEMIRVWEVATGKVLFSLDARTKDIRRLLFSPNNLRLAAANKSEIRIWDVAAGKELLVLKNPALGFFGLAFTPDGDRLALASEHGTVRVFDVATAQELLVFKGPTKGTMSFGVGMDFSPDGRRLAVSGEDQTVRVWDAATGQELFVLRGHTAAVIALCFSPDGSRLATAGGDQTVRIWDGTRGKELLVLQGHKGFLTGLCFSPDGRRLALAGGEQIVRVWETLPPPEGAWRRRALVSQVNALFEDLVLPEKVRAALRKNPTLDEADRQFALEVAESHSLPGNPRSWNEEAWLVVRTRDATPAAYNRALRRAEAAIAMAPQEGQILNTLGVAQYRVGRYGDALVTLTKSEKLNATKEGSLPEDLAFLAMIQHQLGKKDEAKVTLGRLREVMKQPSRAQNTEAAGFLREAEELITGGANKKP